MQGDGWHGRLLKSDNDLRLKNNGMYGARFGMLVCSIGMQAFYAGLPYLPRDLCHAFPLRHELCFSGMRSFRS
jgi:hypothetical protein